MTDLHPDGTSVGFQVNLGRSVHAFALLLLLLFLTSRYYELGTFSWQILSPPTLFNIVVGLGALYAAFYARQAMIIHHSIEGKREKASENRHASGIKRNQLLNALSLSQRYSTDGVSACRHLIRDRFDAEYKQAKDAKPHLNEHTWRTDARLALSAVVSKHSPQHDVKILHATSTILDYFEDVYYAIHHEVADEAFLRHILSSAIHLYADIFKNYIDALRETRDKDMYIGVTNLVVRWPQPPTPHAFPH